MAANLDVVLVSNYVEDHQPSMQRFATLLSSELARHGIAVEMLRPQAILNRSSKGLAKWLGYVDKFLLYPPRLRRTAGRGAASTVVHICDHSNAMYVPWIRHVPHIVTCHDLLAVRRALGEFPGERTRWSGRLLQTMIRRSLQQASCIVSDSRATQCDVQRLVRGTQRDVVIPPAVSSAFTRQSVDVSSGRLASLMPDRRLTLDGRALVRGPFILHVGGDQWYKNRAGVVDIYARLVARMPGAPPLVFAGKPLSRHCLEDIRQRGLYSRVAAFSTVVDEDLAVLYSSANVLLFPSLAEGFGWPVAEAMACGCRVVASDRAPITEIAGEAATYIDPDRAAEAAAAVHDVLLEPADERQARIAAGLTRAATLSPARMALAYIGVYQRVLESRRSAA